MVSPYIAGCVPSEQPQVLVMDCQVSVLAAVSICRGRETWKLASSTSDSSPDEVQSSLQGPERATWTASQPMMST